MKFLKRGLGIILKKPSLIFYKKKRNINFHFDLMHGENNLNKAINLLDDKNKEDFRKLSYFTALYRPTNYSVIIYALLSVTNCEIKLIDVNKMSL